MQTYLVHMRRPRRLWRELGARRFVGFQVLMGGMILSALVHPWFYLLIAFDLWQGRLLAVPDTVFGQWLLGIGVFNLIVGYVSAIALGTVAAARRGRLRLAAHRAAHAGVLVGDLVCGLPRPGAARRGAVLLGEDRARRPPRCIAERARDARREECPWKEGFCRLHRLLAEAPRLRSPAYGLFPGKVQYWTLGVVQCTKFEGWAS